MKVGKILSYRLMRRLIGFFLLVFLLGCTVYGMRNGFKVKNIEFIGNSMNIEFNERVLSGNILFFPSDKIKNELLHEYPQLKDVIIRKKFPHTILIEPILRSPVAILVTSKALYGIDEAGNVLGVESGGKNLPEMYIDPVRVRVGMTLQDEGVQNSLAFLEKSTSLFPVSKIITNGDGSTLIAITEDTQILFTQTQNIDVLIATLQTIVTGIRIKGSMPKIIDVRFTKPVIQW